MLAWTFVKELCILVLDVGDDVWWKVLHGSKAAGDAQLQHLPRDSQNFVHPS